MYRQYWLKILVFLITVTVVLSELSSDCTHTNNSVHSNARVLSRRKRYLIFPQGSSLQLVFCCQTAALIPIGDIFLFGNTAALAWDLPTDPDLLTMFRDNLKGGQRRQDLHEIYYIQDGKILAKMPYKRKHFVNPAFAKRSINEEAMSFKEKLKLKMNRSDMHEGQKRREYLNQEHMNEKTIEFHRNSRVGLYEKLEKLLTALGKNGRQCVLYKLCEARRTSPQQGTFLQELARIIFTLPKGQEFSQASHKEYDVAHHQSTDDCSRIYPDCNLLLPHRIL